MICEAMDRGSCPSGRAREGNEPGSERNDRDSFAIDDGSEPNDLEPEGRDRGPERNKRVRERWEDGW